MALVFRFVWAALVLLMPAAAAAHCRMLDFLARSLLR